MTMLHLGCSPLDPLHLSFFFVPTKTTKTSKELNRYTKYKEKMFSRTHTSFSPWIIVKTNVKETARLECMRYVLSLFEYDNKEDNEVSLLPDPNVIMRYFRSLHKYD